MKRTDELVQAAKDGDVAAVKKICAEDPASLAAAAANGETPLMAALYRGHMHCVEALVEAGAPLDIFAAAALGNLQALDRAIAAGPATVNTEAYDGWTPLHLAAFFGHLQAVDRLLQAGAALNALAANSIRNTPLHAALAGGHVEAALLLIGKGADVRSADAGGHTPLHIAAEAGNLSVVKALLARGADPHAPDADDLTPLARAAARNHTEVIDAITLSGSS